MSKPEIINEVPMNISQLRNELERIKKRDEELNFRGNKTQEYLGQFVGLSDKKADELYKKLEGLKIPRLKEIHIHKLIDILPVTADDVKVVLQGYPISVANDNLKKLAEAVEGFA